MILDVLYTPGNVTIDIIINYKYSEIKVIFIHRYSGLWPSNLQGSIYMDPHLSLQMYLTCTMMILSNNELDKCL